MTEEAVFNYLKSTNRPYSANDIHGNLQSYGKKDITKALESLVEKEKILTKTYGKQSIYFINQDCFTEVKDDDLKQIEENIKVLYTEYEKLSMDLNEKKAEVSRRKEVLPLEEINKKLTSLNAEIKDLQAKIETCSANKVDSSLLKECQEKHAKMKKEANKRKRITKDAFNMILENYEGTKKSLLEELDIDIS